MLREDSERLKTIAQCLPRRFCSSKEGSISNDLRLVSARKVLNNKISAIGKGYSNRSLREVHCQVVDSQNVCSHLQVQVIQLKADCQENEDPKSLAKAWVGPIIDWVS
jgi:hypothetical protein